MSDLCVECITQYKAVPSVFGPANLRDGVIEQQVTGSSIQSLFLHTSYIPLVYLVLQKLHLVVPLPWQSVYAREREIKKHLTSCIVIMMSFRRAKTITLGINTASVPNVFAQSRYHEDFSKLKALQVDC